MTARRMAIRSAARVLCAALDAMDVMPIADAAAACFVPGGPPIDELERRITADRALRSTSTRSTVPAHAAA